MLRSRLPPEGRYGTSYLASDFVKSVCCCIILPALHLGLLTASSTRKRVASNRDNKVKSWGAARRAISVLI